MSSKQFWKPINLITRFPKKGYIHFIFSDDTEECISYTDIETTLKDKTAIMFTEVTPEYKKEFDAGSNRAVDDKYLYTSKLLRELKEKENA